MLGELTPRQRVRLAEQAQEVLESGLIQSTAQGLSSNYIDKLKNLEPADNMGREHLISRLCVLGDVMESIAKELAQRIGDGDQAVQELSDSNG